ncbi:MAG TPA: hypothetical protein VNT50_04250 [Microbacterium sp.]|uniref:hypothetical protein n=1 Tax=Microbacterium sp. TaxID=51671 RepID=UPI002CC1BCD2|nr:hypothetical protein [Microbacterium sp.]HWI30677.1 hypothetical protein [Microbacterium sp.]
MPLESPLLDVLYVALTVALFTLTGIVAKALETTGPHARGAAQRAAMGEGERG